MKNKQPVPVLIPFLILVSMLFIGILIFAYVETKKANPKMIEVGRTPGPRGSPWTLCRPDDQPRGGRRGRRPRTRGSAHHSCMTCTLCGLPSGDAPFCCAGCENVYAILLESGVVASRPELPRHRSLPAEPQAGPDLERRRETAESAVPLDAETREAVFQYRRHVVHFLRLADRARARQTCAASPPPKSCSPRDLLKVRYCPQYVPPRAHRGARDIARLPRRRIHRRQQRPPTPSAKTCCCALGIAAFLSMNVMTFSLVVYASYFEPITASFGRYIPFLLMALATPASSTAPRRFCASPGPARAAGRAAHGIAARHGNPAGLRVQRRAGLSRRQPRLLRYRLRHRHPGAHRQSHRARRQRADHARAHPALPPDARQGAAHARRPRAFRLRRCPAARLASSASSPGERMPADGIVVEGRSHADESVLTGESAPPPKTVGDSVVCGSINTGGVLEIRATRVGADSTLARIVRTVEQAAASRTQMERAVDRAARLFIPAVLDARRDHLRRMAVAHRQARDRADARHRRAGDCLPLRAGHRHAARAHRRRGGRRAARHPGERHARARDHSRRATWWSSTRPAPRPRGEFALLEAAGDTSRMAELAAVEALLGAPHRKGAGGDAPRGLRAAVISPSTPAAASAAWSTERHYFLGNRALADQPHRARPPPCPTSSKADVYFGWDGEVRGALSFGDRVRPDAAALCADLRRRGIRTVLLSGDARAATERRRRPRSAPTNGSPRPRRSAKSNSSASCNGRARAWP